jgi:hypothetical protein
MSDPANPVPANSDLANPDPAKLDPAEECAKLPIPEDAQSFWKIFKREQCEVNVSRKLRQQDSYQPKRTLDGPDLNNLCALALSGGGIRSAVFNLGIIQALAEYGLLRQLDYLSTVSGGGYIGGWLAGWVRRAGSQQVEQRLKQNCQPAPREEQKRYLEPDQVRFLRRYATYLAPHSGMISADTWATLAIYFRNLILNLTLIIIFGAGVLLVPDLVLWRTNLWHPTSTWPMWLILFALLACASVSVGVGLGGLSDDSPARKGWRSEILNREWLFTSFFLFLAALAGSFLLRTTLYQQCWNGSSGPLIQSWIVPGTLIYMAYWAIALVVREYNIRGRSPQPVVSSWPACIFATILAGALESFLLYWVAQLLLFIIHQGPGHLHWTWVMPLVFGPPLLVCTLLLSAVFLMGLAGRAAPDAIREWAARAAAILSLITIAWIIWFGSSLYGPLLVQWFFSSARTSHHWGAVLKWLGTTAWVLISGGGVYAGKSSTTSGNNGNLSWLTKIAPPVFMIGFVLLLSWGVDATLPHLPDFSSHRTAVVDRSKDMCATSTPGTRVQKPKYLHDFSHNHWTDLQGYMDQRIALYLIACTILVLILEWRVDVNEFSMHLFYRNRLTRTFLGASQTKRIADPFTGFSEDDDLALEDLKTICKQFREPIDLIDEMPSDQSTNGPEKWIVPYDGPYTLFCAALNEVQGKELAWRTRKATSFIYSPLYCGYDFFTDDSRGQGKYALCAYRPTSLYSRDTGPRVGTAIAVSGAAASPNMGYHTSPALAFMMTIFDVRLGWWAGNPRHPRTWKQYGPLLGLLYLLKELFPDTNDQMAYVYLSDGGHFENLGVYELVRRKCRYIICCDADCDPASTFDNLGNLVEKCRSDFGVEITIDVSDLKHDENRISKAHYAVGKIEYRNGTIGQLLYIKPTLTGNEPEDIQAYAAKNAAFPYDTTANQFFDESQFESYRELGKYIFQQIMEANGIDPWDGISKAPTLESVFAKLVTT